MAAYDHPIEALGDPTRREVFERLRGGPRAVGELASGLPVSRPAVSQHLRVLKEAGLVRDRRDGARRLYEIDPAGVGELRDWFDELWGEALARFAAHAERTANEGGAMSTVAVAPVRKTLEVSVPPARAFEIFTTELGQWWPTDTHALSPGKVAELVIEPHVGGDWYEVTVSGGRNVVATVLAWEPPSRLVVEWKVSSDRPSTELEVRFAPSGDGTRVELEHRGWEDDGHRGNYDEGWDLVLGLFAAHAG